LRQTGATCLSRIATGPEVDERNASTTVGRRFGAVLEGCCPAGLAPVELWPLSPAPLVAEGAG
jgi:hypothetical protein